MMIVSYLRVSGKSQVEKDGLKRQRDSVQKFAKSQGWVIRHEFREEAVSGTIPIFDREAMSDLVEYLDTIADFHLSGMARLQKQADKIVIIESPDRLARSLVVGELAIMEFRKRGIKVYSATTGLELTAEEDDLSAVLLRQILGAVAEFEKGLFVHRTRKARERKRRETGHCEGPMPYGKDDQERKVLRRMRDWRRMKTKSGRPLSYQKIADKLNKLGIKSRTGGMWSQSSVHAIMTRTKKAGK